MHSSSFSITEKINIFHGNFEFHRWIANEEEVETVCSIDLRMGSTNSTEKRSSFKKI